jgi:hypothetical protein
MVRADLAGRTVPFTHDDLQFDVQQQASLIFFLDRGDCTMAGAVQSDHSAYRRMPSQATKVTATGGTEPACTDRIQPPEGVFGIM